MVRNSKFWQRRKVPADRAGFWRLGTLRLWLVIEGQEWRIAYDYVRSEDASFIFTPVDEVPEDLEWRYFSFGQRWTEFEVRPRMPDRPLLMRPEYPVWLPAEEEVLYYARVPVWIEISVVRGRGKVTPLTSVPSRQLSDTWFGDPQQGELCYSLRVPARRRHEELDATLQHAVWPILIRNKSVHPLEFEKVCVRPQYVAIYAGKQHQWCNEVDMVFRGRGKMTELRYGKQASSSEPGAYELTPAAEPAGDSIITRSFHWISRRYQL